MRCQGFLPETQAPRKTIGEMLCRMKGRTFIHTPWPPRKSGKCNKCSWPTRISQKFISLLFSERCFFSHKLMENVWGEGGSRRNLWHNTPCYLQNNREGQQPCWLLSHSLHNILQFSFNRILHPNLALTMCWHQTHGPTKFNLTIKSSKAHTN